MEGLYEKDHSVLNLWTKFVLSLSLLEQEQTPPGQRVTRHQTWRNSLRRVSSGRLLTRGGPLPDNPPRPGASVPTWKVLHESVGDKLELLKGHSLRHGRHNRNQVSPPLTSSVSVRPPSGPSLESCDRMVPLNTLVDGPQGRRLLKLKKGLEDERIN